MAGWYNVQTRTFLPEGHCYPDDIVSDSHAHFDGDTPHESEIAGDATGVAIAGHTNGHGLYHASRNRYRIGRT